MGITITILQTRKLKFRKIKLFAEKKSEGFKLWNNIL